MGAPPNTARGIGNADTTNIFAIEDSKEFGERIARQVQDWTQANMSTAFALHASNVTLAYSHVFGLDIEGVGANAALITRSGEQGTIAEMRVPAAAGQLKKVWNVIVGPELAWSAVATTTDYASEAEAVTAKNALQYYWADKGVATKAKGCAWEALAYAECAMHVPWNEELGDPISIDESNPDNPRIIKTGDMDFRPVSTWDLIRDPSYKSFDALPFRIVREWENKFEVQARSPDAETGMEALSATAQPNSLTWQPLNRNSVVNSPLIPVYYLYHARTAAVPQGRETCFLENGAVLYDRPLDKAYWKCLPVVRMASAEYSGTPFPYAKFFGVLGSAQASDGLLRDLLTNATSTSGGLVWAEDDSNTPPLQLGGGPKIIFGPKGSKPPQPLNLQQSHPEHFSLLKTLRGESQQILGLDNLTAGQEIGANLSGAAMALMTSTTVQNNSQDQAAWAAFVQGIGNVVLSHIQHHMKEPRRIALAGKSRADLVRTTELSGDKVAGIDRLQVQLGPALQQTDAGKFELGQLMLKQGWAQTPQQLQTVLDTGRLDSLTQDLSNELLLINNENEALSEGKQVSVMLGDNHLLHLKLHRPVTASLTARQDPNVVNALQAHEAQHLKILQETDPKILQLFGQPSLASPPEAGPPPPSESVKLGAANLAVKSGWATTPQAAQAVFVSGKLDAGQTAGNPAAAGNPPPGVGAPSPQAQAQAQAPKLPTNPQTGQPAGPVAGTTPPSLAVKPS